MKAIYESLKELRKIKNFTQEDVAKILGVKREVISYYENGQREISLSDLKSILKFFGISMEDFQNKKYDSGLETAYRKEKIDCDDFEEIIMLNTFVNNLYEMKEMNKKK